MTTRLYAVSDYLVIAPWWEAHGTKRVPENILPKCGVVVKDEEEELMGAAWLYQDNSVGVAWLAWMVSNPHQPLFHVEPALRHLLGACEAAAKELGYGLLFTMTERPAFGRWLLQQGFSANHQKTVQYFKNLNLPSHYGP